MIHFTTAGDCCQYGTRQPGYFINTNDKKFHFIFINIDENTAEQIHEFLSEEIEFGREYNIHMQTETAEMDGNQIHKIWLSIDDVIVGVIYNYDAREFDDVKVYTSNIWYEAGDATIKEMDYGPIEYSDKPKGDILNPFKFRCRI